MCLKFDLDLLKEGLFIVVLLFSHYLLLVCKRNIVIFVSSNLKLINCLAENLFSYLASATGAVKCFFTNLKWSKAAI